MSLLIGKTLKLYREKKKLSRSEFASIIGVSTSSITNWEKGYNRPDLERIIKICEVLGLSSDTLLGIQVTNNNLSDQEKKLIKQYREKQELRSAVAILLDI